jgi:acetyl esterase/lipase
MATPGEDTAGRARHTLRTEPTVTPEESTSRLRTSGSVPVSYMRSTAGVSLLGDYYAPEGMTSAPAIVAVHGGGVIR